MLNLSPGLYQRLQDDPNLIRAVEIFGSSFRTTHVFTERRRQDNTYGYLFLNPLEQIKYNYNIRREVLFFVDESINFTSLALQEIEKVLESNKDRLTQDVVFVAAQSVGAEELCTDHMNSTGRKIIFTSFSELQSATEHFATELLRRFFYQRDLFDVSDPVSTDDQFFARYKLIDDLYSSLLEGQSCGIFGLRKIGKTSVLERLRNKNDLLRKFHIAYIDSQSPEINKSDPAGIAHEICVRFNRSYASAHGKPFDKELRRSDDLIKSSSAFSDYIGRLLAQSNKQLLVVFDELERILPTRQSTNPWNTQYVDLWRMLRAESQNRRGKLVFLVASTNPYFTEVAQVLDEDNPLYRWIRATYLSPFSIDNLSEMIEKLGRPMGMSFEPQSIEKIHSWFGGHPFLSRQLCSAIAKAKPARPIHVTERDVELITRDNGAQFASDFDAILKVFTDYYPDERELLEELIRNGRSASESIRSGSMEGRHLTGYGLLRKTKNSVDFNMDALEPYLRATKTQQFKLDKIPDRAKERHAILQQKMNNIEPALRSLVLGRLQAEFGREWFSKVQMKSDDRQRIDEKGNLTNQEVIEEVFLSDLIATVQHFWRFFSKVFENREDFAKYGKDLRSLARTIADHRKFEISSDDAKYLAATAATEWFIDKLL